MTVNVDKKALSLVYEEFLVPSPPSYFDKGETMLKTHKALADALASIKPAELRSGADHTEDVVHFVATMTWKNAVRSVARALGDNENEFNAEEFLTRTTIED